MNYKQYLEENTGWRVVDAHVQAQSVIYSCRHRKFEETLVIEILATSATVLTLGKERKTIPSKSDVSKTYGREATELDMLRLFNQVLQKMEERLKSDSQRDIESAFNRHARQQM